MADKQHIFVDTQAPISPPNEVGHHHVDTANKKQYLAVGTTLVTDWIEVGSGGGGGVVYNAIWPEEGP